MKNLAGLMSADGSITEELKQAYIPIIRADGRGEVPYNFAGKLDDWSFKRAWCYWDATASERSKGLPLSVATELHFKEYPKNTDVKKTAYSNGPIRIYGQVVRVEGHCGCPEPKEWALPTEDVLKRELKKLGIDCRHVTNRELAKLFNEDKVIVDRFVDNYHIDTQLGLDEFARTVKGLEFSRDVNCLHTH